MKKKINLMLSFLTFLGLTAFNTTSEKDVKDLSLVGHWEAISIERSGCDDPSINGTIGMSCPSVCMRYTFYEDGSLEWYYDDSASEEMTREGTYTVEGNTIVMCENGSEKPCGQATITEDNGLLIIEAKEEYSGCTVVTRFNKK